MKVTDEQWKIAQEGEAKWWDNATNTLIEDLKQMSNTKRMGLVLDQAASLWVNCNGKSIIDIGGGVTSLLLKSYNFKEAVVIDPMPMPKWVEMRNKASKIKVIHDKAENLLKYYPEGKIAFDEAWIYNCLQHVQDPELIIQNVKKVVTLIRMQEWIGIASDDKHPHTLNEADLTTWLGSKGSVGILNERFLVGRVFYGVFSTTNQSKV